MQSQKQNTDPLALNYQKLTASRDKNSHTLKQEREEAREVRRSRSRSREAHRQVPLEVRWHIYELCPLPELEKRIPAEILKLPIFRKK